ncbi:MAG: hypothetical protein ACQSGP_23715 [Frankia sp.]
MSYYEEPARDLAGPLLPAITIRTPFVILTMARSGSWHLVELLNEHPQIASNGEVLNNHDETSGWRPGDRGNLTDSELLDIGIRFFPAPRPQNLPGGSGL